MKIGMDINICEKVNCKHLDKTSHNCRLVECGNISQYSATHRCRVPKKCPYKAIQVIRGFLIWCGCGACVGKQ